MEWKNLWFEFIIFAVGVCLALAGLYGSLTTVTDGITISDVYFLCVSTLGIIAMLAGVMMIQINKAVCQCQ